MRDRLPDGTMNDVKQTKNKKTMAKKLSTMAIDAIIKNFVIPMMQWAGEYTGCFFFLIIGCKDKITDVAWRNSRALEVDGAASIAGNPRAAALFETLRVGVDCMSEDFHQDAIYEKEFQDFISDDDDHIWYSDNWGKKEKE